TIRDHIPVTLLLCSVATNFIADLIFAHENVHGTYVTGDWVDGLWTIGCIPFVMSAYYYDLLARRGSVSTPANDTRSSFPALPYIAVGLAFAILILVDFDDNLDLEGFDIIGATILTALVVVRQFLYL